MFYRSLFKKAWQITWRFKVLWLFGLLTSWGFLNRGGELGLFLRARAWLAAPLVAFPTLQGIWYSDIWQVNFLKLAWVEPLAFVKLLILVLLALVLLLLIIWLAIMAQIILIKGAQSLSQAQPFFWSTYLKSDWRKVWPVLFLNLFIKILITLAFGLLLLPFWTNFLGGHPRFSIVFVLVTFLLLLPLVALLSLIVRYAIQFVVLKNEKVFSALRQGRRLLFNNLLPSLEMVIILAGLYFLAGLALVLLFLFSAAPFIIITVGGFFVRAPVFFWTGLSATVVAGLIIVLWGGAVFAALQWSAWTLFFAQIAKQPVLSKLERVIDKILRKKFFKR